MSFRLFIVHAFIVAVISPQRAICQAVPSPACSKRVKSPVDEKQTTGADNGKARPGNGLRAFDVFGQSSQDRKAQKTLLAMSRDRGCMVSHCA